MSVEKRYLFILIAGVILSSCSPSKEVPTLTSTVNHQVSDNKRQKAQEGGIESPTPSNYLEEPQDPAQKRFEPSLDVTPESLVGALEKKEGGFLISVFPEEFVKLVATTTHTVRKKEIDLDGVKPAEVLIEMHGPGFVFGKQLKDTDAKLELLFAVVLRECGGTWQPIDIFDFATGEYASCEIVESKLKKDNGAGFILAKCDGWGMTDTNRWHILYHLNDDGLTPVFCYETFGEHAHAGLRIDAKIEYEQMKITIRGRRVVAGTAEIPAINSYKRFKEVYLWNGTRFSRRSGGEGGCCVHAPWDLRLDVPSGTSSTN